MADYPTNWQNMSNASHDENSPSSQKQSQNFPNFPRYNLSTNMQNYAYSPNFSNPNPPPNFSNLNNSSNFFNLNYPPNFSNTNYLPNFQNQPDISNPFQTYLNPGYHNFAMANQFPRFHNSGTSGDSSRNSTETGRDQDFGSGQGDTTPTGSASTTQIPPFSTQHGIENIVLTDGPSEETNRKRIPWTIEDEKMLASAWLTISNCSKVGNSQNDKLFWKRITAYFNENNISRPTRNTTPLKSHWNWVNSKVNEFNQYYNKLVGEHHSGWNDEQYKQHARELFFEANNKHFSYEHVWLVVKDDPKWKTTYPLLPLSKKTRISKSGAYSSSSNVDTSVEIDDNEVEVRPIGQKAAKKGKRKIKSDGSNEKFDASINHIQDLLVQQQERKEQLIGTLASKLDTHTHTLEKYAFQRDYDILMKDTTGMTEKQLEAHEHMCSILKARYNFP